MTEPRNNSSVLTPQVLGAHLLDAHVHLDFMTNGEEVAADAAAAGAHLLACTVTPQGYQEARQRFAAFSNVQVGLGLHPWWVQDTSDADAVIEQLSDVQFVGEIGLDFGKRHQHTQQHQLQAFQRIAQACAQQGGKTISVHSVHAAREALDVLEQAGVFETCTCIFHWYSGPSDQLKRAIQAGVWFSAGTRMAATKRGREYLRIIPANRLLLESDAPPQQGQPYSFKQLSEELLKAQQAIQQIKGA